MVAPRARTGPRLSLAAVAVATAGDALYRYQHTSQDQGSGLRGGKWQAADGGDENRATLDLTEAKWVNDVAVSGSVTRDRNGGEVSATVDVTGADDTVRRFTLRWSTTRADSPATIASGDQQPPFAATTPAPRPSARYSSCRRHHQPPAGSQLRPGGCSQGSWRPSAVRSR